jgi:drug/metabolite transporter (DMT)-like permease
VVLPEKEIRLVDGIMQTFSHFFGAFHIPWFTPILTLLIIIGSVGFSVLAALYPVGTVILARVVLGERLVAVQAAGVGVTLAGVALIAAG